MKSVIGFIDGFNVYHALMKRDQHGQQPLVRYRWLDYWKLVEGFLKSDDSLKVVYLFTAYADWNQDKKNRHKILIRANKDRGVSVVFGKFRKVSRNCRSCKKTYQTYEEKRTDVNIAITMLKLAICDGFEKAILISADSDLLPAIKAIKEAKSNTEITVVTPIGLSGQALANNADSHLRMDRRHLNKAVLPATIKLKNGSSISCPKEWL